MTTYEELDTQLDTLIALHASDPIASAAIDTASKHVVHMVFHTYGVTNENFLPRFTSILAKYPDPAHKELARQSFQLTAKILTVLVQDRVAEVHA